jgi:DNA-directed RNA polymerase subunit L
MINFGIFPKLNKSLDIIIEKLNILINNILDENIGKNGIIFNKYQDLDNTYEFSIENEDDTLGNIIQSYVHSRYVREGNMTPDNMKCSYAGYICPHPLKTELLLRFTLDNQNEPLKFIKFFFLNSAQVHVLDLLEKFLMQRQVETSRRYKT